MELGMFASCLENGELADVKARTKVDIYIRPNEREARTRTLKGTSNYHTIRRRNSDGIILTKKIYLKVMNLEVEV